MVHWLFFFNRLVIMVYWNGKRRVKGKYIYCVCQCLLLISFWCGFSNCVMFNLTANKNNICLIYLIKSRSHWFFTLVAQKEEEASTAEGSKRKETNSGRKKSADLKKERSHRKKEKSGAGTKERPKTEETGKSGHTQRHESDPTKGVMVCRCV